jgi:transcriptional regulator with XRE-family HTH domain
MNTRNAELKKKIATNLAIFQSVRRADLAMQIRTKMLEKGLRSVDLAERLGVSEANVSRWLRGNQNLGIDTMHLLADALEVPLKITFSESSAISQEEPSTTYWNADVFEGEVDIQAGTTSVHVAYNKVISLNHYSELRKNLTVEPQHKKFNQTRSESGITYSSDSLKAYY